jgi:hypothetical protein
MGAHNHGGEWILHIPYGLGDNSTINTMPVILVCMDLPEVPKGEVYGGTSDAWGWIS